MVRPTGIASLLRKKDHEKRTKIAGSMNGYGLTDLLSPVSNYLTSSCFKLSGLLCVRLFDSPPVPPNIMTSLTSSSHSVPLQEGYSDLNMHVSFLNLTRRARQKSSAKDLLPVAPIQLILQHSDGSPKLL